MLVCHKLTDDPTVFMKPHISTFLYQLELKLKKGLSYLIKFLQRNDNTGLHTLGLFSIISARYINSMDVDVVHLHWVNFEMLSIKQISKIEKPLVWTFHDAWPMLGSEHAFRLNGIPRYIEGYKKSNNTSKGIDIDKMIFDLKKRYLSDKNFTIALPSKTLKNSIEKSLLLGSHKNEVIPNFLPKEAYGQLKKEESRASLNLEKDTLYILCIAYEVTSFLKGGDLIQQILDHDFGQKVSFLLIGKDAERFKHHSSALPIGLVEDRERLNKYYTASDICLIPSRQESFSLTALESLSCGTPTISFRVGAIPEMVKHGETGYLADEMTIESLIQGIEYHLKNPLKVEKEDIKEIEETFDEDLVLDKLINVYRSF